MHSGAVTESGKLYMWGDNRDCRLFKELQHYKQSKRPRNFAYPQYCDVFEYMKFKQVSCGTSHTLALTAYGEVFAAGGNEYGQLGVKQYQFNPETCEQPYIKLERFQVS